MTMVLLFIGAAICFVGGIWLLVVAFQGGATKTACHSSPTDYTAPMFLNLHWWK